MVSIETFRVLLADNDFLVGKLVGAKPLKMFMKSSGVKLSSNAYDTLNQFAMQYLTCLVSEACKASSNREDFAGLSPSFGPANVSWNYLIMAVRDISPSLEGWFTTWYNQLTDHVNSIHYNDLPGTLSRINICSNFLPGDMPCCKEMGERCNLIVMEECDKTIRLAIPPKRTFNWFAVVTMACTLNEIVQWILKISLKVLQTKGLGTLRRAELSAIIAKAPIFEHLHPYLSALQERPVLLPSPKQPPIKSPLVPSSYPALPRHIDAHCYHPWSGPSMFLGQLTNNNS